MGERACALAVCQLSASTCRTYRVALWQASKGGWGRKADAELGHPAWEREAVLAAWHALLSAREPADVRRAADALADALLA